MDFFSFSKSDLRVSVALDADQSIAPDIILGVLKNEVQALIHGTVFSGRPVTKIISNEDYVIKWRSEYRLSEANTRRWIAFTVARERNYRVHHPAKTWFYIHQNETTLLFNITPRLVSLQAIQDKQDFTALLNYIVPFMNMYFALAARDQRKLDEGLSNYGVDKSGQLFYLDDDIYAWDDFVGFSQAIGVLLRKLHWLEPEQSRALGESASISLIKYFPDEHWIAVVNRLIDGAFLANDTQKTLKRHFQDGFLASYKKNRKSVVRIRPIERKRFAVLADIHANYPALQAVLACLDQWDILDAIVLGDIVGYGPHPGRCIAAIRERNFLVIKGNHDHALAREEVDSGFSTYASWAINWSMAQVGRQEKNWLAELPAYHQQDNWLAVHGAPKDKMFFNAYVYRLTYEDNLNYMAEHDLALCLHGHTHIQGVYSLNKSIMGFIQNSRFDMHSCERALVCPGSVGQPRSRQVGAEFAVYDTAAESFQFYRIKYDMEKTVRDMEKSNFPYALISRLKEGK